jgi:uroporphyrin-III C-methyltransferase/precorrin-2 dehydrogenase/sirohydrochlorin ferrochelatase
VVIVENGTLESERALSVDLSDLAHAIAERGIRGPAVIFVGLDWTKAGLSRPDKVEVFTPEDAREGAASTGKGADATALSG